MLKLNFVENNLESVWLTEGFFDIGSADSNNLQLQNANLEPQHARILFTGGQFILTNLSHGQDCTVNGETVASRALEDGDVIKLGSQTLEVIDPLAANHYVNWTLVANSSWLQGQEFPVQAKRADNIIVVGRANHCDLIFPGTHLSREHARIIVSNECLQIQDLNSSNGTFINDVRVKEGKLYAGDLLRLDVYSFKVYGPGKRPDQKAINHDLLTYKHPSSGPEIQSTRLRSAIIVPTAMEHSTPAPKTTAGVQKRWKTRPTSPGNRAPELESKSSIIAAKWIALLLTLSVLTLIIYLIWG